KWGLNVNLVLKRPGTIEETVALAEKHELEHIEVLFEHPLSFCSRESLALQKRVAKKTRGFSTSIHAPFAYSDLLALCKPVRDNSFAETRAAIDYAAAIDAAFVTMHVGSVSIFSEKLYREFIARDVAKLFDYAASVGMPLLTENVPSKRAFKRSYPGTPADFREMERLLKRRLAVCFDPPHAMISGCGVYDFAKKMGSRIAEVHLQDGSAKSEHLALGNGEIDFKRLFRILKNEGFDGFMVFELPYARDLNASVAKAAALGLMD
ncbi:hypothetical protein COT58_03275, partial [Candidatus Micrarchaeota archaeon CG09_land_8_20_14_0_10_60_16]